MLGRVLLFAVAVLSIGWFESSALAAHPFQGSGQGYGGNWLYRDLESGGDGRISYKLCDSGQYGAAALWGQGVEAWDSALGSGVEFDLVACSSPTYNTVVAWDGYDGKTCGGGWACWVWPVTGEYTTHGTHRDISLGKGRILVIQSAWLAQPTNEWRIYIAAHEWGHNMSLADHVSSDCGPGTEDTLMLNYNDGNPIPPNPCVPLPGGTDVTSVWCTIYRTCAWHGFSSWGWPADVPPAAVANDYTRADHTHMVRVSSCDLFEKYWTGSVWTGWVNRSSGSSDPCFTAAAISISDGQTHIVGSTSGDLWHKWRTGEGPFNTWTYLGKPGATEYIDGPLAIANSNGQIHVVGVSKAPGLTTGTVYLKMYRGTWEPWQNLGGNDTIGGSVAVANRGGLIHVVGFTPISAHVWLVYWNGVSWQGWEDLACCLDGALAIDNTNAVPRNTVLTPHVGVHVLALSGGVVRMRCWDSYCSGGGAWLAQGGGGYTAPLALTNTYGEVHLVSRYSATELQHRERNP